MKWRAFRATVFWLRAVLLVFAMSRFVAAHQEVRPVYATATVGAVVYNSLFNLRHARLP